MVPLVWHAGIVGAAIAAALGLLMEQTTLAVVAFRRFAMRPRELLKRIWRCLLATAALTAFLAVSGLGWTQKAAPDTMANIRLLLVAAAGGAVVYFVVLLALWLASGRPPGPETDVWELIRSIGRRVRSLLNRRAAVL